MNNIKLLPLLLIALATAGCSSQQSTTVGDETTPFLGGTQALSIAFEQGAPPDEFYDTSGGGGYPFDINLMIRNIGETVIPANNLYLKIMGILPTDFGKELTDMQKPNSLMLEPTEKDSDGNIIEGTEIDLGVNGLEYNHELTGNMQFPIRADVCFKYQTRANAKLCYKEDFSDFKDTRICIPRDVKTVYNSAAPIHVTTLEQNVIGSDKISFTMTIERVGNGKVYQQGFTTGGYKCSWDLPENQNAREVEDIVDIAVNPGVTGTLSCPTLGENACSGNTCNGTIKLYNDRRVVRCTFQLTNDFDFEKVVDISLDYNFEESIEKTILGKHGI